MTTQRRIAFFDFDGTLVRHDSLLRFARFALPHRRFLSGLLRSLPAIMMWKVKLMSADNAKQRLFSNWFAGLSLDNLKIAGQDFAAIINKDTKREAMKLLKARKAEGCVTVIVSASMPLWIQPWADSNGFDHVIGTEPDVDSRGLLTGRFATPNCRGKEKERRICEVFPDIDKCITYAYGDSRSDSAMMKMTTYSERL